MQGVPAGWEELLTTDDGVRTAGRGGVVVITDDARDEAIYHTRACPSVTRAEFVEKVVESRDAGRRPNGRYFWVAKREDADAGGARACKLPTDPVNA